MPLVWMRIIQDPLAIIGRSRAGYALTIGDPFRRVVRATPGGRLTVLGSAGGTVGADQRTMIFKRCVRMRTENRYYRTDTDQSRSLSVWTITKKKIPNLKQAEQYVGSVVACSAKIPDIKVRIHQLAVDIIRGTT